MSWLDDLGAPPPPVRVKVATVASTTGVVHVRFDGVEMPARWGSVFSAVLSANGVGGVNGMQVLLLLPDGQPFISDIYVGS